MSSPARCWCASTTRTRSRKTSKRWLPKIAAEAQLANINAGTRAEVTAARKAARERAESSVILAQKTYDRKRQLAEHGNAPQAQVD